MTVALTELGIKRGLSPFPMLSMHWVHSRSCV